MERTRIIAGSLVVAAMACGEKSSLTAPGRPRSITLAVEAPASIAPGSSAQIKLTGVYSDGTRTDLTSQARWSSSDPEVAQVSESGLATANREGETTIQADSGGSRVTMVLLVLEPGTFKASGLVNDGAIPIPNARVDVLTGTGSGKVATTDITGSFRLYGIQGDVRLRFSADEYQSLTRDLTVTATRSLGSFTLLPVKPTLDVSGEWMLTIETAASCNALPEIARRRTYTATIHQLGAGLSIALAAASPSRVLGYFYGSINGDRISFNVIDTYYPGFPGISEQIDSTTTYTVAGSAIGRATQSSIDTTLAADIAVRRLNQPQSICSSPAHRLSLVRSTTAQP